MLTSLVAAPKVFALEELDLSQVSAVDCSVVSLVRSHSPTLTNVTLEVTGSSLVIQAWKDLFSALDALISGASVVLSLDRCFDDALNLYSSSEHDFRQQFQRSDMLWVLQYLADLETLEQPDWCVWFVTGDN